MASSRERRLAKELQDIHNDRDSSGITAQPVEHANLTHLRGTFPGPPDSPYTGGTFAIDIRIPDGYPFKAPVMKFETKIWHPNVSSQTVCPPLHSRSRYEGLVVVLTRRKGRHLPRHP
jgi:ubiquitin-conjugating enzyme (huntingtin interacting protein 2)